MPLLTSGKQQRIGFFTWLRSEWTSWISIKKFCRKFSHFCTSHTTLTQFRCYAPSYWKLHFCKTCVSYWCTFRKFICITAYATALAQGLCHGLIAPISRISCKWFLTSSYMLGGILHLSLNAVSYVNLILCFTSNVFPNIKNILGKDTNKIIWLMI